MTPPLVSIICTCYNHGEYIQEALEGVADQHYFPLELIIIDSGSHDDSVNKIQHWIQNNPQRISITTVFHPHTLNYCQSFNKALAMAKGKYVIDLSGDDVLLPGHVAMAVKTLENHPYTVYFSNAYLEEVHKPLTTFYPVDDKQKPLREVLEGDIYQQVIQRTILCPPTLVFPIQMLRNEGGYDEGLSYEDFDIIVRLARKCNFVFNEHLGVKKRILKSSFSAQQYKVRSSVMLPSTLKVCHKIRRMNRSQQEDQALGQRILYETKHALASANFEIAAGFLDLAEEIGADGLRFRLLRMWEKLRLDLSFLYRYYIRFR